MIVNPIRCVRRHAGNETQADLGLMLEKEELIYLVGIIYMILTSSKICSSLNLHVLEESISYFSVISSSMHRTVASIIALSYRHEANSDVMRGRTFA